MIKRGQVSVFVIISLVVLIAVAGVIYLEWDYLEDNLFSKLGFFQTVPEEVQPIYDMVVGCMERTAFDVVPYNAWQGGYYGLGENANPYGVGYYLVEGKSYAPSILFLQKELNKGMEDNLGYCLDYSDFTDYVIESKDFTFDSIIEDDAITFNMNYPMKITFLNETFVINKFRYVLPVRYGELYGASLEHVELQQSSNDICLDCLWDVEEEYGFDYEYYNPSAGEVEFVWIDQESIIEDRPLMFAYAARFNV